MGFHFGLSHERFCLVVWFFGSKNMSWQRESLSRGAAREDGPAAAQPAPGAAGRGALGCYQGPRRTPRRGGSARARVWLAQGGQRRTFAFARATRRAGAAAEAPLDARTQQGPRALGGRGGCRCPPPCPAAPARRPRHAPAWALRCGWLLQREVHPLAPAPSWRLSAWET